MKRADFLQDWLDGKITPEKARALGRLAEYEALEKLDRALQAFRPVPTDAEPEYNRWQSRKPLAKPRGQQVLLPRLMPVLKMAAVLLLAVGVYFFLFLHAPEISVSTSAGQRLQIELPDGSTAILNAQSAIAYVPKKWNDKREVKLEGEAFFKVARGAAFDVLTGAGTVRVLGTEFNVNHRPGFFEVTCFEGRVRVQYGNETEVLQAGEIFRMVNGTPHADLNTTRKAASWTEGESRFESVPLAHVVREFERQYGVTVQLKNTDSLQLFTGSFVHGNQTQALKSLSLPFNLRPEFRGDRIILVGEAK
jgi:ferric-dicitrate binding protein FerR (iron transport regulator)